MKPISHRYSLLALGLCGLVMLAVTSCRENKPLEPVSADPLPITVAPELSENRLAGLSGEIYGSYSTSPIHWQPWSSELFTWSKDSKRLLFCVIGISQQSGFHEIMQGLQADPEMVDTINNEYIPVLIDADQAREFIMLSKLLSHEIGRSLAYPVLVWMDFEGNPVACTPVATNSPGGVTQVFNQSHAMVGSIWKDDLEFWMVRGKQGHVIGNSARDQNNRRTRILEEVKGRTYCTDLSQDVPAAIRQLMSEYDPDTQQFAEPGGRMPVKTIRLLCRTAQDARLPESLRSQARTMVRGLLDQLLPSAMFDVLDEGAFIRRVENSWELPHFIKDGASQADIAGALFEASMVTGDGKIADRARRLLAHLEASCRGDDGLFMSRPNHDIDPLRWMWTVDEVSGVLGAEDARWWQEITGMQVLGNLPIEADPTRQLLRKNALGMKQSIESVAKQFSVEPTVLAKRYDQARQKLLDARNARLREDAPVKAAHLEASLQMVSAYVSAHRATGDARYAEQAQQLMQGIREKFVRNGVLCLSTSTMTDALSQARAGHYALAVIAAMDVASLGQGDVWIAQAGRWLDEVSSMMIHEGMMLEAPPDARLINLPLESYVCHVGDSSVGLMSIAAARVEAAGRPVNKNLQKLVFQVPRAAKRKPLDYVGLLHGSLIRNP